MRFFFSFFVYGYFEENFPCSPCGLVNTAKTKVKTSGHFYCFSAVLTTEKKENIWKNLKDEEAHFTVHLGFGKLKIELIRKCQYLWFK